MKKKWIAAAVVAVMLLVGMSTAFAAGGMGRHFADADGDGICDNAGTNCGRYFVDAD